MIKPFDSSIFMSEFMGNGGFLFDASAILPLYNIDKYLELGCEHPTVKQEMLELVEVIKSGYFGDFKMTGKYDFMNKETYGNIERWHSDAEYIFPGQNCTINCFFDDTSPEVGGRFDIMHYDPALLGTNGDSEEKISFYPKKNTILVFNQNRTWMHKVIPSTQPRRMISIAGQFHDFNHVIPNFQ